MQKSHNSGWRFPLLIVALLGFLATTGCAIGASTNDASSKDNTYYESRNGRQIPRDGGGPVTRSIYQNAAPASASSAPTATTLNQALQQRALRAADGSCDPPVSPQYRDACEAK